MKTYFYCFILSIIFFLNSSIINNKKLDFINRRIYSFNRGVEKIFFYPLTNLYIKMPNIIDKSVCNFFFNIEDIQNLLINIQKKNTKIIYENIYKIILNSTFGIIGFLNLTNNLEYKTKKINKIKITNYFSDDYINFFFIGPETLKGLINIIILQVINPIFIYTNKNLIIYYTINIINKKSFIPIDHNYLHKNSIDGYSFIKDIFLQNIKKNI